MSPCGTDEEKVTDKVELPAKLGVGGCCVAPGGILTLIVVVDVAFVSVMLVIVLVEDTFLITSHAVQYAFFLAGVKLKKLNTEKQVKVKKANLLSATFSIG